MPILPSRELSALRRSLLAWYDANRRDLPWRKDADPYRVWVSEVMLQQTRVAAVIEHYARFMKRFPTVQALAAAREQSVLAAWSGLGYYHRARRMHQAARAIARERKGEFPNRAAGWLELPGIGRYTAAAIASIAFAAPVAVVDGNVERVLARLTGIAEGREAVWTQAETLLDRHRPGDFNQAMMELGATICAPRAPQCLACPLMQWCKTRGAEPPRPQPARNRQRLSYALVRRSDAVLLVQRATDARLMAGMWELPEIPGNEFDGDQPIATFRHSITNTDYSIAVYRLPARRRETGSQHRWFTPREWQRLPLTGLTRKILRKLMPESGSALAESKKRND